MINESYNPTIEQLLIENRELRKKLEEYQEHSITYRLRYVDQHCGAIPSDALKEYATRDVIHKFADDIVRQNLTKEEKTNYSECTDYTFSITILKGE